MTLNDAINEVLEDWAVEFTRNREQAARDKLGQASGKAAASFAQEVRKAAANDVATALFAFEGYLRYSDMKRVRKTGSEPVDEIRLWVEQKGIQKFANKFRQLYQDAPTNPTALANRIAWAIARSKPKRRKRRAWYTKSREDDISELYRRLLEAAAEATAKGLKVKAV